MRNQHIYAIVGLAAVAIISTGFAVSSAVGKASEVVAGTQPKVSPETPPSSPQGGVAAAKGEMPVPPEKPADKPPAPAQKASAPSVVKPVPAADMAELAELADEGVELQARYRRELRQWRAKSKTVERADEVNRKQATLIKRVADERKLDAACFVGALKEGTAPFDACRDAGKLWGIDEQGRIATQAPTAN